MASPLNFSKVPPWPSSSPRTRAWYGATSDLTSSGSRFSERAVDPTRSTKIAVMTFRSSLGAGAAASGEPQKPQSRNFAGFVSPHDGQIAVCGSAGLRLGSRERSAAEAANAELVGVLLAAAGTDLHVVRVYEPIRLRSKPAPLGEGDLQALAGDQRRLPDRLERCRRPGRRAPRVRDPNAWDRGGTWQAGALRPPERTSLHGRRSNVPSRACSGIRPRCIANRGRADRPLPRDPSPRSTGARRRPRRSGTARGRVGRRARDLRLRSGSRAWGRDARPPGPPPPRFRPATARAAHPRTSRRRGLPRGRSGRAAATGSARCAHGVSQSSTAVPQNRSFQPALQSGAKKPSPSTWSRWRWVRQI